MGKQLFKGNPEFPDEPRLIAAAANSGATDIIYALDTLGEAVTLDAGMLKEDGSPSEWAGQAFTGFLFGKWTNVGSDKRLACYVVNPANSEQ